MRLVDLLTSSSIIGIGILLVISPALDLIRKTEQKSNLIALEKHLLDEDFKSANELTWQIFFESLDSNQDQHLSSEEYAENLDCTLIGQLDGRWSSRTFHQFGFSAQADNIKKADQMHSKDLNLQMWQEYWYELMGWSKNQDSPLHYLEPNYSVSAPKGHLPNPWVSESYRMYSAEGEFRFFYETLETCGFLSTQLTD